MPETKIAALRLLIHEPESLQESRPDILSRAENVVDASNPDPLATVEFMHLGRELRRMLREELRPKEGEIVMLRYGLKGNDALTLEEVGALYGVTRERIRQIEAKALLKLAIPARAEVLTPFLELDFGIAARARLDRLRVTRQLADPDGRFQ